MASRYVPISTPSNNSYSYVNEDQIDPELKCAICQQPFIKPVVGAECGHTFCKTCLDHWYQQNSSCPTCRRSTKFEPLNTRVFLNQLNRLLVKCPQCQRNNIERGNFSDHIQSRCAKTILQCQAVDLNCSWTGNREQYVRHSSECSLLIIRPVVEELRNDISGLGCQLQMFMDDVQDQLNSLKRQSAKLPTQTKNDSQKNCDVIDQDQEVKHVEMLATDLTRLWKTGYCGDMTCQYCKSYDQIPTYKCVLCSRSVIYEHICAHDAKSNAIDVICRLCFPKYRDKLIISGRDILWK